MDDKLPPFTEAFFSYFNKEPELNLNEDEFNSLIKTKLYANNEALYYSGQSNNLDTLKQDPNYPILQQQLGLIVDQIKAWGKKESIPDIDSLEAFKHRLIYPEEDSITLFYSKDKKKLEIISVLLQDPKIDLSFRQNTVLKLLADRSLTQCISNCHIIIVNAYERLIHFKNNQNKIHSLVREYTTELAEKVTTRRPFALPKSFQETLCDIKSLPRLSHENHAQNLLLSYAKDNAFPVNTIQDVIATKMAETSEHLTLNHAYITELKKYFTALDLIEHLSRSFHPVLSDIHRDHRKVYGEFTNKISNKLDEIGHDNRFSFHELLDEDGNLKGHEHLKMTLLRRFLDRGWLSKPHDIRIHLKGHIYHYYEFTNEPDLNFLSSIRENKQIEYYQLKDVAKLLKPTFDLTTHTAILKKIFKDSLYLNRLEDYTTLLHYGSSSIAQFFDKETLCRLIKETSDAKSISVFLKKTSEDYQNKILSLLSPADLKTILEKGFSKANPINQYPILPQNYLLSYANKDSMQDSLYVTRDLIVLFAKNKLPAFSNFIFPKLETVLYFNGLSFQEIDFSGATIKTPINNANFLNTKFVATRFHETILSSRFDNCQLDNAIFYQNLHTVSFMRSDLRNTDFFEVALIQIDLSHAKLSTVVFQRFLLDSITDFKSADLSEVHFNEIENFEKLTLDFSNANLKNADLSGKDLRKIKLHACNLQGSNLLNTKLDKKNIDHRMNIESASLELENAYLLHEFGILSFKKCKIYSDNLIPNEEPYLFNGADFSQAQLMGSFTCFKFGQCDFDEATFTRLGENKYLAYSIFKQCTFHNIAFDNIVLYNIQFTDCHFKNIQFNNVAMSAEDLYNFYRLGHQDFRGVSKLKGSPKFALSAFPLANALLSEEVFLHFYYLGNRDFRNSHLKGFYLAETLASRRISEIELRLKGALYKPSILACLNTSEKQKRDGTASLSMRHASPCHFFFLIQKAYPIEPSISMEAVIHSLPSNLKKQIIPKEINIDIKPLFLLDKPSEITLYWGYPPSEESRAKAIHFINQAIIASQRNEIVINVYFTRSYTSDFPIKVFSLDLSQLGLQKGQLSYYDQHEQPISFNLQTRLQTRPSIHFIKLPTSNKNNLPKAPRIPIPPNASSAPSKTIPVSPLSNIDSPPLLRAPHAPQPIDPHTEKKRNKLIHFAKLLKTSTSKTVRSGIKQGAHYELGAILLSLIGTWIMQANMPEVRAIDNQTKGTLKDFALDFINKKADERNMHYSHQRQTTLTIISRCIERGECATEEEVKEEIIFYLEMQKSDVAVGNEVFLSKIKGFFETIGKFIVENFNQIKEAFQTVLPKNRKWDVRHPAFIAKSMAIKSTSKKLNTSQFIEVKPKRSSTTVQLLSPLLFIEEAKIQSTISNHNNNTSQLFSSGNLSMVEENKSSYLFLDQLSSDDLPNLVSKRRIYFGNEIPILTPVLQNIELIFNELGYDLDRDPDFSESELVGLLYDLWLDLDAEGINNQSKPELVISLLKNDSFTQNFLHRIYFEEEERLFNATSLPSITTTENNEFSEIDLNETSIIDAFQLRENIEIENDTLPDNSTKKEDNIRSKRAMQPELLFLFHKADDSPAFEREKNQATSAATSYKGFIYSTLSNMKFYLSSIKNIFFQPFSYKKERSHAAFLPEKTLPYFLDTRINEKTFFTEKLSMGSRTEIKTENKESFNFTKNNLDHFLITADFFARTFFKLRKNNSSYTIKQTISSSIKISLTKN